MRLVHSDFYCEIEWKGSHLKKIIIENTKDFRCFLYELYQQSNSGEGKWILSEECKVISISKKCKIIVDLFQISLNEKKILTALYDSMEKNVQSSEYYLEWIEIKNSMEKFIWDITDQEEYSFQYKDELVLKDFFKWTGIQYLEQKDDLCSQLIEYMNLYHRILKVDLFVLVNATNYFSDREIKYMEEQASYEKYNILLWEANVGKTDTEKYDSIVIDQDSCLIL